MSLLALGTVALDTVKTPHGERKQMLGGSAAHFSMSARLFTDVHLVAVVGEDFPDKHVDFLKRKGLIIDSLIRESGKTFSWSGEYKGDLNTAFTLNTELGVLATFKPVISERQKNIKNVFLANVDPDIQLELLRCMRMPRLTGLDSMNYWIDNKRSALLKVLKEVDIFVANDQETRSLSGENNLIKAAKSLSGMGPKMVLIKKGEHGVFFYSDKFMLALPAYPAEDVIDPTGAGDTFAGAFMGYLSRAKSLNRQNLKRALEYGTIAASFNIEDFGLDRTHQLTIKQLNSRLRFFEKCLL
jgi:sugar/nucleoside kinase (ribokinase family)